MTTGRQINYKILITILLIVIIVAAGITIWLRYPHHQPLEISLAPQPEVSGEIYVGGSITNPGFYPFTAGDTIADIILAAGGTTDRADLSRIKLYIPEAGEEAPPQKVNLNRAQAWLLEALPGIGKTRAEAIIAYRQQNGRFHHIAELLEVEGIGINTYERIKHLITVAD